MNRGSLALLAVVVLSGWVYLFYQRTGPVPDPPAELASLDALLVEAIEEELANVGANRRSLEAWRRVGLTYEANALFADAERCYERTLELWPEDGRTYYQLACVRERSGDLERAVEAMRRACELAPDYGGAWSRLAAWNLDLGEIEPAERALERARELLGEDDVVRLLEVRLALARRDAEGALALLGREGVLSGDDGYAYHLLSVARRQTGDLEGAEEAHAKGQGSRLAFSDPWSLEMMGMQRGYAAMRRTAARHVQTGRYESAWGLLEQVLENDPNDVRSLNMQAVCAMEMGDNARALELLERVFALEPEHHDGSLNYTKALLRSGTKKEEYVVQAERRLTTALAKRPTDVSGWRLLITLEEHRGRPDLALAALDRLLELEPQATDVRLKGAYLSLTLQRFDDALTRFRDLQERSPDLGEAWLGEATVLVYAGRKAEATELLEKLVGRAGIDAARIAKLRAVLDRGQ